MIRLIELREAIVQRLKDASIPRIGDSVYPERAKKFFPDSMPAICVYTRKTPFEGQDRQPRWMQAETLLMVETVVRDEYDPGGGDPIVSVADQLNMFSQAIIDTLIYTWDGDLDSTGSLGPFGGLADDICLADISSDITEEGEHLIGGEAVTFKVEWQTLLPDEEPPDTFARMGMNIKTPEEANAPDLDIEDVVTLDVDP